MSLTFSVHNFTKQSLFCLGTAMFFLMACGDDSGNSNGAGPLEDLSAATFNELPNCSSNREGSMAFVEDESANYLCSGGHWLFQEPLMDTVATEEDLPACTAKHEGDSLFVKAGEVAYVCFEGKWEVHELINSSSVTSSSTLNDGSEVLSSSSVRQSTFSGDVAEVHPAGYYKTNCPSGHTCKEAAPSTYLNSEITYGEILDTRDDQVYKVVTIGDQTWMAQNLNYEPEDFSEMGEYAWSGCYEHSADSCAKYGRLYDWVAAMNDADCALDNTCSPSGNVQGLCPNGWHLPSYEEWETLFTFTKTLPRGLLPTTGWREIDDQEFCCFDGDYGFSALPAGLHMKRTHRFCGDELEQPGCVSGAYEFDRVGWQAFFWSSSEINSEMVYRVSVEVWRMLYAGDGPELGYDRFNKSYPIAYSVRCIQDQI